MISTSHHLVVTGVVLKCIYGVDAGCRWKGFAGGFPATARASTWRSPGPGLAAGLCGYDPVYVRPVGIRTNVPKPIRLVVSAANFS